MAVHLDLDVVDNKSEKSYNKMSGHTDREVKELKTARHYLNQSCPPKNISQNMSNTLKTGL